MQGRERTLGRDERLATLELLFGERLRLERVFNVLRQRKSLVLKHVAVHKRLDVHTRQKLLGVSLETRGRDLCTQEKLDQYLPIASCLHGTSRTIKSGELLLDSVGESLRQVCAVVTDVRIRLLEAKILVRALELRKKTMFSTRH